MFASRVTEHSRRTRNALGAAVAVGTIAALVGCSGGGEGGGDVSGMDGDTIKMFIWVGNDDEAAKWQTYIKGAQLSIPDLSVAIDGPAISDYYTKLPTQLKGSDAPCIVAFQNGQVPPFATAIEPLGSWLEKYDIDVEDYNSAMVAQLSVDGDLYALPFDAQPRVLYYNKAMFEAAGVPEPSLNWTIDEFMDAAKKTTTDEVWGFAVSKGAYPIGSFMAAEGNSYINPDGTIEWDSPELMEKTQWYFDLAAVDKVAKPLEASAGNFPDLEAFSNQLTAMFTNGTWDYVNQGNAIGKENLGVAVIPTADGNPQGDIAGAGFAVTKSCGDKDAAFQAIAAMTSSESLQLVATERGEVPARADAMDAWQAQAGEQVGEVANALLNNGFISNTANDNQKLTDLFNQYSVDGYNGNATAEEVWAQVQAGMGQ